MNEQQRAVVQQALEALEDFVDVIKYDSEQDDIGRRACCDVMSYKQHSKTCKAYKAIHSLLQQLEQPVQEPVAWRVRYHYGTDGMAKRIGAWRLHVYSPTPEEDKEIEPLYTTHAQPAAWVGLTDEDYPEADNPYCCVNSDFIAGARWADATLRQKNGITASAKAVSK